MPRTTSLDEFKVAASADGPKVLAVGVDVEAVGAGVTIALAGVGEESDFVGRDVVVDAHDVVLRVDVRVAKLARRQSRHEVVAVGDPEVPTGLGADEVGKGFVTDARGAVGILLLLRRKRFVSWMGPVFFGGNWGVGKCGGGG